MKLIAELETTEYTKREIDPEDSWDAGCYGITLQSVSVYEARSEDLHNNYDEAFDELPVSIGDEVTVLVEHYGDGCTFGNSEYMEVRGIFRTYEDAKVFSKTLKPDHGYFGWFEGWIMETATVKGKR